MPHAATDKTRHKNIADDPMSMLQKHFHVPVHLCVSAGTSAATSPSSVFQFLLLCKIEKTALFNVIKEKLMINLTFPSA